MRIASAICFVAQASLKLEVDDSRCCCGNCAISHLNRSVSSAPAASAAGLDLSAGNPRRGVGGKPRHLADVVQCTIATNEI